MGRTKVIIECIDKLNSIITNEIEEYLKYFGNEDEWKEVSFTDTESIDIEAISNEAGLYYIQVNFNNQLNKFSSKKNIIEHVAEEWKNGSQGNTPKINKKRMRTIDKNILKNGVWIPFYLGKAQKLNERIEEHLTGAEKGDGTYKLNLQQNKSEVFNNSKYRIKTIKIDKLKEDKYYWIVTRIESELREHLNPICGKQ